MSHFPAIRGNLSENFQHVQNTSLDSIHIRILTSGKAERLTRHGSVTTSMSQGNRNASQAKNHVM